MLSNLKVAKKLALAFAAIVLVFVCVSAMVQINLKSIDVSADQKDASKVVIDAGDEMYATLVEQQNAVRGYVLTRDESFMQSYREKGEAYAASLAVFKKTSDDPGQLERVEKLDELAKAWRKTAEQQVALARSEETHAQALAMTATSG